MSVNVADPGMSSMLKIPTASVSRCVLNMELLVCLGVLMSARERSASSTHAVNELCDSDSPLITA